MRFLILKDKKITGLQLLELQRQFTDLVFEHTGLSPVFYVQEEDYSNVPTEPDGDGDLKPTNAYMSALMAKVHKKYGDYGVDSVVPLVHQDNWIYTGIWGYNTSNLFYKYHVHFCRFDKKNIANSLGTLYHEWMHCLDVLIKTHTGFDVNGLFGLPYDKYIVHGGRPDKENSTKWKYIKWKDNVEALELMAPHIKAAYNVRKELYLEPYKNVQKMFISWLRSFINKKQK